MLIDISTISTHIGTTGGLHHAYHEEGRENVPSSRGTPSDGLSTLHRERQREPRTGFRSKSYETVSGTPGPIRPTKTQASPTSRWASVTRPPC